jgi:hypothetical protein
MLLPLALTLGLLAQGSDGAESPVHVRFGVELEGALLPSGFPEGTPLNSTSAGGLDVFGVVRPLAGLSVGERFSLDLGPTFRFRLIDTGPGQRAGDFGGVLRREDWDQLSDFGQLVQSLKVGAEGDVFALRAGAFEKKTLGAGHLINRYSNQDNPDTHPAGADVVLSLGPVRLSAFASDVLAARLFAGDVAWDLGATFSPSAEVKGRYLLSLELAHDAGQVAYAAGCVSERCLTPTVTLLQLDGQAVLLRQQAVRLLVLAGVGSRADRQADLGLLAGLATDLTAKELGLSVKVELRKQAGGFRQGFFGPGYELSRFTGVGLQLAPQASEQLPDGFSLYAEARVGVGTAVSADVAAEHFFWGRTDVDARIEATLLEARLSAVARYTALGLGTSPRQAVSLGLRLRLVPSVYVLGSGGTVFFPAPDGGLTRGVTASLGAGFDFER